MIYYLDLTSVPKDIMGPLLAKIPISGIFVKEKQLDQHQLDEIDKSLKQYVISDDVIKDGDKIVGKILEINQEEDMQSAMKADIPSNIQLLLIETSNWQIIPLENLIAKYDSSPIQILARATAPEEIKLLDDILELGVNGCVLSFPDHGMYDSLELDTQRVKYDLKPLPVTNISRIGTGDRVCVDTCSLLKPGEGLLVGSTSAVLALTEAEVEETGYVNARPFRVNAGVVATYVMHGNRTNYLSELKAGSEVTIVNNEGNSRREVVARLKIEKRPLILVEVEYENRSFPIILQDAETVKLQSEEGTIRVTDLQVGTDILCYTSDKARHFGMEIDEFIEER